jgi:SAM-dependent methyltransferase
MTDLVARSPEWADPDQATIEALAVRSAREGWRPALDELEPKFPFFAKRMRDLGLANWHLLLLKPRRSRALDIGCGFGSLPLGLSEYFESVTGLDALIGRVKYARLRAVQDKRPARFAVGSAHHLPIATASVDFVTMNGVLEWAALFADSGRATSPEVLQRHMLSEAKRVLAPKGHVAVAIENRYAMETLVGMPDTHTGLRLVPALPRRIASAISRIAKGEPFRTFLYDAPGYRRLARSAGFRRVRVFDLVSSYNDYDYIVAVGDAASYRLLWQRDAVRTFQARAGSVRRQVARVWPGGLGTFAYAYLVLMGDDVTTLLDPGHALWSQARERGVQPGQYRFAVKGSGTGSIAIVTHDGTRVESLIELGLDVPPTGAKFSCVPDGVIAAFDLRPERTDTWSMDGVNLRAHRLATHSQG